MLAKEESVQCQTGRRKKLTETDVMMTVKLYKPTEYYRVEDPSKHWGQGIISSEYLKNRLKKLSSNC